MATLNFDLEQSNDFVRSPSVRDFIDSESQRTRQSHRQIDQQNWSRKLVQNVVTSGGLSYVVTGFNPAGALAGAAGGAITTLAEYMTTSGQQYFRGQHLLTEFAVHSSQVLLQTGVNTALKRTAETAIRSFTSFFASKVSGYASDKILSYTKLKENQFVRAVTNTAVSLGVGYAVDAATTATMNGVKYVLAHQSTTEAPATTPSQTDGTTTQAGTESTTQQAKTATESTTTVKPNPTTKPPEQSTTHSTPHTPSTEAATTYQTTTEAPTTTSRSYQNLNDCIENSECACKGVENDFSNPFQREMCVQQQQTCEPCRPYLVEQSTTPSLPAPLPPHEDILDCARETCPDANLHRQCEILTPPSTITQTDCLSAACLPDLTEECIRNTLQINNCTPCQSSLPQATTAAGAA